MPGTLGAVQVCSSHFIRTNWITFSTAPFTAKSWIYVFNRLVLFVSLVLFASSRRKAEKSLREQGELLQVTLASIGDAVIATDVNGRVNFINPTAAAITGGMQALPAEKRLMKYFRSSTKIQVSPLKALSQSSSAKEMCGAGKTTLF